MFKLMCFIVATYAMTCDSHNAYFLCTLGVLLWALFGD